MPRTPLIPIAPFLLAVVLAPCSARAQSVVGSGSVSLGPAFPPGYHYHVAVTARTDASGAVTGHLEVAYPEVNDYGIITGHIRFVLPVVRLMVVENMAIVAADWTSDFEFVITDNGQGPGAPPDRLNGVPVAGNFIIRPR